MTPNLIGVGMGCNLIKKRRLKDLLILPSDERKYAANRYYHTIWKHCNRRKSWPHMNVINVSFFGDSLIWHWHWLLVFPLVVSLLLFFFFGWMCGSVNILVTPRFATVSPRSFFLFFVSRSFSMHSVMILSPYLCCWRTSQLYILRHHLYFNWTIQNK